MTIDQPAGDNSCVFMVRKTFYELLKKILSRGSEKKSRKKNIKIYCPLCFAPYCNERKIINNSNNSNNSKESNINDNKNIGIVMMILINIIIVIRKIQKDWDDNNNKNGNTNNDSKDDDEPAHNKRHQLLSKLVLPESLT